MKLRILACAAIVGCALGATSAMAQSDAQFSAAKPNAAVTLHAFVDKWQKRILAENLSVADPMNWGARSLPKLAAFSPERLDMAMRATTIGELEAMFVTAPIAQGTRMKTLMDAKPGNVSLDAFTARKVSMQKDDPTTTPANYDDVMFNVLNPCRIFDSRVSQGGAGPFINAVSRQIKIGPYATGYQTGSGAQGGSASSCGLDTLSAGTGIPAVLVAVSSFSQTGAGYLTFYPYSLPDPSATVVSMFYTAGPVQTAFVLVPTDMQLPVWARGISRGANSEVTIDVVGYFESPKPLECLSGTAESFNLAINYQTYHYTTAVCPAGMRVVSSYCWNNDIDGVYLTGSGTNNGAWCGWRNLTGVAQDVWQNTQCCKLPGGR